MGGFLIGDVGGDAVEPALRTRRAVVLSPMPQRFEERLVAQNFGRLTLAHHALQVAQYRPVVFVVELFDRLGRGRVRSHIATSWSQFQSREESEPS